MPHIGLDKTIMDNSVVIYSTPTCHFCHMAKEYFDSHNVKYTDNDVTSDPAKLQEMREKSGQMGVPVIFIGGEMVIGFDEQRVSSLLAEKGITKDEANNDQ